MRTTTESPESPESPRPAADPLLELCETLLAEGCALNVDPEALLRATAEAFDFLFARSRGIAR